MDKEELIKLLDNRPGAWLGRKMGYARPKETVNRWVNGHAKIPVKRIEEIRTLCRPAGPTGADGRVITDIQVNEIINYLLNTYSSQSWGITHVCGQGYDWTHMTVNQRDFFEESISQCRTCKNYRRSLNMEGNCFVCG